MASATLELLTVDQVAALFHVRPDTVGAWVQLGKLPPPLRIGHRRLWRSADLEEYVEQMCEGRR